MASKNGFGVWFSLDRFNSERSDTLQRSNRRLLELRESPNLAKENTITIYPFFSFISAANWTFKRIILFPHHLYSATKANANTAFWTRCAAPHASYCYAKRPIFLSISREVQRVRGRHFNPDCWPCVCLAADRTLFHKTNISFSCNILLFYTEEERR